MTVDKLVDSDKQTTSLSLLPQGTETQTKCSFPTKVMQKKTSGSGKWNRLNVSRDKV